MPKVSVIMGIYNTIKKEYLEKSINSILNQTFKDFEFIICDDGSTNECFEWAKELCKADARCILIKNEKNEGLSYTLNRCLEIANGKYIARMDDDDISDVTRLEKQVDILDKTDYGVVSSNANLFDDDGIYGQLVYPEIISRENFLYGNPIIHPSVLVRKEAYNTVNGYRNLKITTRVEDYDLFMRMYANGIKQYVLQERLLNYRQDNNSLRKRKFKYRINESIVRAYGFYKMQLYPKAIVFVIKPLIVGLLPIKILKQLRRKN